MRTGKGNFSVPFECNTCSNNASDLKETLIHKKSQWLCLKNLIQFLNLGKIFDELIYKA